MGPSSWQSESHKVTLTGTSTVLRCNRAFYLRSVLGTSTYVAGRSKWRSRAHVIARKKRIEELRKQGIPLPVWVK